MTEPLLEIEARAYGPESSPAEVAAIRARVRRHSDALILWQEMPVMSGFSIDLLYAQVEALHAAHGCRGLIIDARATKRPTAENRRMLHARIAALEGKILRSAVVMSGNPFVKVAARFIAAVAPIPLTMHTSFEEAEASVMRQLSSIA